MTAIKHIDFRRLDLNLLVTLAALMATRNVPRAAERLRLGQPAVSHRLARLRQLLGDPLLVPTAGGLRPTPRALALAGRGRRLLEDAHDIFVPSAAFQPLRWSGNVTVALPDTLEMSLLPALAVHLRSKAPGVRLTVHAASDWRRAIESLETANLDLYAGFAKDLKPWHRSMKLWDETFLAVFSPKQLKLELPLSLKDFLLHPHIMATPREGTVQGRTDRVLARLRRKREVVISTPHFLAVPHVLLESPLIAVMHARPARRLAAFFGLKASELPFDMGTIPEMLVWHASLDGEPAQEWLRGTIAKIAQTLKI